MEREHFENVLCNSAVVTAAKERTACVIRIAWRTFSLALRFRTIRLFVVILCFQSGYQTLLEVASKVPRGFSPSDPRGTGYRG